MTMWLGCTECGAVEELMVMAPTCSCEADYRILASVAEKLEFKLTMAERADEAAAVRKAAATFAEEMRLHMCRAAAKWAELAQRVHRRSAP